MRRCDLSVPIELVMQYLFYFRFKESLPQSAKMHFLAELFELPERDGGRAPDVYWCFVDFDGFVEFYSNTPEATNLLDGINDI